MIVLNPIRIAKTEIVYGLSMILREIKVFLFQNLALNQTYLYQNIFFLFLHNDNMLFEKLHRNDQMANVMKYLYLVETIGWIS